jgi:orotate phosphoribosyltransferase
MNPTGPSASRDARDRLLQLLIETQSFRYSETPTFTLASGAVSRFYVDCRVGLSYPEVRRLVGRLMAERAAGVEIDVVGGMLVAAYPVAIAVSDAFYDAGKLLRVFMVRKEPKAHGLKKQVEGAFRPGDRALIVEDIITSGGSTIEAIRRSREAGLEVVKAIAIIDRQEQNGRQNIEAEGVPFEALCTLEDLRALVTASR